MEKPMNTCASCRLLQRGIQTEHREHGDLRRDRDKQSDEHAGERSISYFNLPLDREIASRRTLRA